MIVRCRNNDAEIGDDDDFGCQSTESDKVYLKIIYVHEQSASDDDVILRDVSEGLILANSQRKPSVSQARGIFCSYEE